MDPTRITLVQKLKNPTDHVAWEDFFDIYSGPILRFVQKKGLDDSTAKDVLQETMILLMSLLQNFEYDPAVGKFRNYIFTITHRLVLKHARRSYRTREISMHLAVGEDGLSIEDLLSAPAEVSAMEDDDQREWLASILDSTIARLQSDARITPKGIEIFVAVKRYGEDPHLVATRYGMTRNAVDQAIFRVKKHVARILAEKYGVAHDLF